MERYRLVNDFMTLTPDGPWMRVAALEALAAANADAAKTLGGESR